MTTIDSTVHVFAYGSNMHTERLRVRVPSAEPITTGYVTHRRLAFHKRGQDGSAKANALFTGSDKDRVWGVVFSMKLRERIVLDEFELAYDIEEVEVASKRGALPASIYVASPEAVDDKLEPFSWYHLLTIRGAEQHGLPEHYVRHLRSFESTVDHDRERCRQNMRLVETDT